MRICHAACDGRRCIGQEVRGGGVGEGRCVVLVDRLDTRLLISVSVITLLACPSHNSTFYAVECCSPCDNSDGGKMFLHKKTHSKCINVTLF